MPWIAVKLSRKGAVLVINPRVPCYLELQIKIIICARGQVQIPLELGASGTELQNKGLQHLNPLEVQIKVEIRARGQCHIPLELGASGTELQNKGRQHLNQRPRRALQLM